MNQIILLSGIAGTGKKTIGQAITEINPMFKLVHHHDYLDPILKLLNKNPKNINPDSIWWDLDDNGWESLKKARRVAFDTIAYACSADDSFVITYELLKNDIYHQAIFDEIKKLADIRNATFIPVRLICELEELLKRLCSHERKKYYKTQDVQLIKQRYSNTEVFQSRLKNELTIDVSSLSPEESAHKIISWAQQCHN